MPGGSGVAQWANGGKSTEPSPIPLLLYIVFWDTRTGSNRPVTRPVTRPGHCRHCPCIQNSWEQPSRYWGHSTRPGLASNADPSAFRPPAFARPIAQLPNCPGNAPRPSISVNRQCHRVNRPCPGNARPFGNACHSTFPWPCPWQSLVYQGLTCLLPSACTIFLALLCILFLRFVKTSINSVSQFQTSIVL